MLFRSLTAGGRGILGHAATRLEPCIMRTGACARGGYPAIDELYKQPSVERDHKKREALLHQI